MQGHQAPIAVRRATSSDRELLLAWRNDPQTRAASRSSAVIDPVEHAAWFVDVMADPRRLLLIGEQEQTPIGTVRFDSRDPGAGLEISVTIAPDHRGRGLSVPLLLAAESAALDAFGATPIWAFVLSVNDASTASFTRAGYLPVDDSVDGTWLRKGEGPL